ncbi:hemolymph juvenile hormone-binding protein [Oryctes borbonicus]|uniref:Hemolymph juvenile hormone-binding protein n=1 Tax=Oryctes borbonicus TaxID=1629725 RepID=A0A0T6BHF4_9SCAR|nr:hemolymph juvenile hormone-binding protein [Oryctes borbonicus]
MKCSLILFICTVCFSYSAIYGKELPSFVKKCKRNDPGLNDCMKNALIEFKKYLPDGVEEMKLPPLNPYLLPKANIETPWMNTTLTNLKLYNSYGYTLDYFDIDLDKGVIKLNTTVDHMEMNSRYEIDGKILQFVLHGEGEMEGKVNNTKVGIILNGTKINRKGKEYLILENIDYKLLEPPKAYMYFHDLFRNNPEITERVNMVIQENQEELFKDIYPLVEKIISTIDLSLFKGVFDNFSLDELFD